MDGSELRKVLVAEIASKMAKLPNTSMPKEMLVEIFEAMRTLHPVSASPGSSSFCSVPIPKMPSTPTRGKLSGPSGRQYSGPRLLQRPGSYGLHETNNH